MGAREPVRARAPLRPRRPAARPLPLPPLALGALARTDAAGHGLADERAPRRARTADRRVALHPPPPRAASAAPGGDRGGRRVPAGSRRPGRLRRGQLLAAAARRGAGRRSLTLRWTHVRPGSIRY